MTEPFDYLQRRLATQRKWHDEKATWNKQRFYLIEVVTLLASAAIPVVNLWVPTENAPRILSVILGAIIVIAVGIGKLYKFHENWLHYRNLTETLAREEELYQTGVGEYATAPDNDARNHLLVVRIENILAGNVAQFLAVHRATSPPTIKEKKTR